MTPGRIQRCAFAILIGASLSSASLGQDTQPPVGGDKAPIPAIWKSMSPQARLMAERAARVDARLRLIERIMRLRLSATTQVRDFTPQSDLLTVALGDIARAAIETASNLRGDYPIAESTLRLPADQVEQAIKMLHRQYYKGAEITPQAIDKLAAELGSRDIVATGVGLPPLVYLSEFAAASGREVPTWATRAVEAGSRTDQDSDGGPIDPLRAARAAETAARQKLSQQIAKLSVGKQTIGALAASSEAIRAGVDSLVAEAAVSHTRVEAAYVEVTLRIPGARILSVLRSKPASSQKQP